MGLGEASLIAVAAGVGLAYVNGANDAAKGVATLVGAGLAATRAALWWGCAWTLVGALSGLLFGGAMLMTFASAVVVPSAAPAVGAGIASLAGAAGWVMLATRLALPVSTTHALIGAMTGAGAIAYGAEAVQWAILVPKVVLPLAVTPLIAYLLARRLTALLTDRKRAVPGPDCVCVIETPATVPLRGSALALPRADAIGFALVAERREVCAVRDDARLRLSFDHLHWLTSAAISLARGLNDAPKIVAATIGVAGLGAGAVATIQDLYFLIGLGMFAGGLIAGSRVTHVLAHGIVMLDHRSGFAANALTAVLVGTGGSLGLPMSTTHVSGAAIAGAGPIAHAGGRSVIRNVLIAWGVTVPGAAALGIAFYLLLATVTFN